MSVVRAPDFGAMDVGRQLALLADVQRERARLDATEARLLAALYAGSLPAIAAEPPLARTPQDLDKQWVREEVALVLRLSSGTARSIMLGCHELVSRFPTTLATLERGEITARHATRLVEACIAVPDGPAGAIETRVLKRAASQSLAQFGASVRRAVAALAPKSIEQQYDDAREERRVVFTRHDDGTSELWACGLSAADAIAMEAAIRSRARQWKNANPADERTADQRQADALTALILGTEQDPAVTGSSGVQPAVNVTVALSTLLALDNRPGQLDGHGPIPAELARALAFDPQGTWRRLLTDHNNQLVDVTAHTYRPPANMARFVRLADQTCCFPGCRRRAVNCELDHIVPWCQGGTTTPANLEPLCSRHHHVKHEAGWRVRRAPDGATIWTSPTGHTYARPPDELPIDATSDPPSSQAA